MGVSKPKTSISAEISRHNDIIIGDFEEHSVNKTLKG